MKAITITTHDREWRQLAEEAAGRVRQYCAPVSDVAIIGCEPEVLHREKILACINASGPTLFFDSDLWFISPTNPYDVLTKNLVSAAHAFIPECHTVRRWSKESNVDPMLWINSGLMIFDADACRPIFQEALNLRDHANENRDEVFINRALAAADYPVRLLPATWNLFIGAGEAAHGWAPFPIRAVHAAGIKAGKFEKLAAFVPSYAA